MSTQVASGAATGADGYGAGVDAATDAVEDLDGATVDFCQLFCSVHYDYADVLEGVRSVVGDDAELIGCVGTGPFTERGSHDTGVTLGVVSSEVIAVQTGLGTGLSESTGRAIRDARGEITDGPEEFPYRSAFVLYDAFATDGEELAHRIRRKLGARVPFSGGAASDDYRLESTPVFRNDRVETDAVAVAVLDSERPPLVVDGHGHEPISETMEVTSADGAQLRTLDGDPAFEVWRDAVRPYVREMFDIDVDALDPASPEMLRMTGVFEFGIDQGDAYKLRACIRTDPEAGTMSSLVDIPEGTRVRVMRGTVDSQIESARAVAREARDRFEGAYAGGFVYDCACRQIILGESFDTAVDALAEELSTPFAGFETYGEMSMSFDRTSGFHNSTTVVTLLPR